MPRDANGNYTLPAGNPVATDTLIASGWANNTMGDLGTEMQDSLSRSGKGGFTAPVGIVDKSGSVPGLNFISEPTSGFKREGAGDLRVQVQGTDNIRFLRVNQATDVWNNDLTTPAWERVFTTPAPNVLDGNVKLIQSCRETVAATIPATLEEGQLCVNVADTPPKLYTGPAGGGVPLEVGQVNPETVFLPSGTPLLYYLDIAPLGWTILQAVDDHSIALTKGLAATGIEGGTLSGTVGYSTVFVPTATTSTAPSHTHFVSGSTGANGDTSTRGNDNNGSSQLHSHSVNITSGGGGGHDHTIDLDVARAHCIIATKD